MNCEFNEVHSSSYPPVSACAIEQLLITRTKHIFEWFSCDLLLLPSTANASHASNLLFQKAPANSYGDFN